MTETMPALAVTALLQERAMASARWPTRGAVADGAVGVRVQIRDPQDRQVGRRVPARELGVEGLTVVRAHVQSVFAAERVRRGDDDAVGVDEAAGRPPAALHLDDRGGHRRDGVGHLVREFIQHAVILTNAARRPHHPNGQLVTCVTTDCRIEIGIGWNQTRVAPIPNPQSLLPIAIPTPAVHACA